MKIKFYGVRGSYPVPGPDTIRYGGNTTCVSITEEVDGAICRVIIDAGTGIINLGKEMVTNYFLKKESLNFPILFTHLHPDHTQGFAFFAPNFIKDSIITLAGMEALSEDVSMVLSKTMTPPQFPIQYNHLKSTRDVIILRDSSEFNVESWVPLNMNSHGNVNLEKDIHVCCIWDNESRYGGDKSVVNFAKNCDVMIHDTQYIEEEYNSSKMIVQGFGHSTYEMAINDARLANVKNLYCIHYNPSHTDDFLDDIEYKVIQKNHTIILAKEGMEVEV